MSGASETAAGFLVSAHGSDILDVPEKNVPGME
jgi:hypothetical protein